jgi:hypothetical protein
VNELFVDADSEDSLDALNVTLNAGELSLVLQIFHAAGVMVGLAMRSGVSVYIPLPRHAYRVLSNSEDWPSCAREDICSRRLLLRTSSLALRTGMLSLYPEAALDLLHVDEMQRLFEGRSLSCGGCVGVAELFRSAEYVGEFVESMHMQVSSNVCLLLAIRLIKSLFSTSGRSCTNCPPVRLASFSGSCSPAAGISAATRPASTRCCTADGQCDCASCATDP